MTEEEDRKEDFGVFALVIAYMLIVAAIFLLIGACS